MHSRVVKSGTSDAKKRAPFGPKDFLMTHAVCSVNDRHERMLLSHIVMVVMIVMIVMIVMLTTKS